MSNQRNLIILIILLTIAALFTGVDKLALRAEEPRRAVVAMEMVISGDYIVPRINGWEYYNKPPVFNWILAGFYKLTGSFSEWNSRFPGLFFFLVWVLFHFKISKNYVGKEIALISSFFFLTAADLLFYGLVNAGEIDIFFSFLTYVQVVLIFHFYEKKKLLSLFLVSYILCAIGVLTKGPPSLLFQALTLLVYIGLYKRRMLLLFGWQHILGILTLFGLVGGYYYVYDLQTGQGIPYAVRLLKEATQKSALETNIWDTLLGAIVYPFNLVKLLLPWSLLIYLLFKKGSVKVVKRNPFIWFSVLFILANLPIYWFTGKAVNRYIYMFFPFILGVFAYLAFSLKNSDRYLKRFSLRTVMIATIVLLGLRIVMNFTYLPYIQYKGNKQYEIHIDAMLEIVGDNPISFYGQPYTFNSDVSIPLGDTIKATLRTAPLIAYQIPYYYTSKTHRILTFTEKEPINDTYNLVLSPALDTSTTDVLYSFDEGWQPNTVVYLVESKMDEDKK